jgi:hypothetical protein
MTAFSRDAWINAQTKAAEAAYLQRVIGPKWDDLRFPAQAVNPPGAVSDPDVDSSDGCLLFDAAGVEVIFVAAQLPHGWLSGTPIRPHVHWVKTTSAEGDVVWGLKYRWAAPGQTLTDWSASYSLATVTAGDADTADHHALASFPELTIRGGASTMILFEIARIGSSEDDTYAADAKLLEFDLHYQTGSAGTTNEFTD